MLGFRRDQTTGTQEGGRAKAADRKPMWIVLEVEHTEFQQFSDNLRIHGIISEAEKDKGSHHTHSVSPGDDLEITWAGGMSSEDKSLLSEAYADSGRARAGIIVVEGDEVLLFEVAQHGMRSISQFTMRGGGKREAHSTEVRNSFIRKAAEQTALIFDESKPLVICGPGMAREQFESVLRGSGGSRQTLNVATSIGGRAAANEVLREGVADALLGEYAVVRQVKAIEDAMARISTKGDVAYGGEMMLKAAEQGAVATLVIEADLLRSDNGPSSEISWSDYARKVKTRAGEVVQASRDHDAGEQLMGMGGAIALLRWAVE
jgi:protein pelota